METMATGEQIDEYDLIIAGGTSCQPTIRILQLYI